MPARGPMSNVNTALRSPFGSRPIWTELGAPARNTTSHSLMPSATPPPSNAAASAAGAAGAVTWLPGAGAGAGAIAGGGQDPLLLTRSFAVIGRCRCFDSCNSEKVYPPLRPLTSSGLANQAWGLLQSTSAQPESASAVASAASTPQQLVRSCTPAVP